VIVWWCFDGDPEGARQWSSVARGWSDGGSVLIWNWPSPAWW
jgi:hypothetical protein